MDQVARGDHLTGLIEQVSRGLASRQRAGRASKSPLAEEFLLAHIAVCGGCGHTIRRFLDPRLHGGGYYQCAKRHDPRKYRDRTPCPNKSLAKWHETDAAAEAQIIARLDTLASELSAHTPKPKQPPPDWKRLKAEIGEARAKVVRLVVSGVITEDDARKHLAELRRPEPPPEGDGFSRVDRGRPRAA